MPQQGIHDTVSHIPSYLGDASLGLPPSCASFEPPQAPRRCGHCSVFDQKQLSRKGTGIRVPLPRDWHHARLVTISVGTGEMAGADRLRKARIGRALRLRKAEPAKALDEQPTLLSRAAGVWMTLKTFVLNTAGTLIFLSALILLYKAVVQPAIAISPISVPKELADKGYTPEATALQLQRALKKIVHDAKSMKHGADVTTQMDVPNIIVPRTGLSLETIAAEIRSLLGIVSR